MQRNILFRGISFLKRNALLANRHQLKRVTVNKHYYNFSMAGGRGDGEDLDPSIDIIDDSVNDSMEGLGAKDLPQPVKYSFHEKTIAFEVEFPVFPYMKEIIHVDDVKYRILNRHMPLFITTIIKNSNEAEVNPESELKSRYYPIGTYCQAEFTDIPNKIVLSGMHRVEIKELTTQQITDEELSIADQGYEINQDKGAKATHIHLVENDVINAKAPLLPSRKDKNLKLISNDSLPKNQNLIASISRIINPDFNMNIQIETQLKHLIEIHSQINLLTQKNPYYAFNSSYANFREAYIIVDSIGGLLSTIKYFTAHEVQDAFSAIDIVPRLDKVHVMLSKYLVFLRNFSEIGKQANETIKKRKAAQFYEEVFKIVKGAVETEKGKQGFLAKLRKILAAKKPSEEVLKIFEEESQKYLSMDESSTESNISRTYLDWLASLPYGVESEDQFDLDKARAILEEEHYGMKEIKDRILEFIAVGKLRGSLAGKILCLAGPPGVGKTSLAPSIAKALNRKYARISMGGESDSSFLKGHRKTYIGAYPGKIIQALKECGTENCVILLDEIDKLGRSEIHGDPQGNLLEILDPSQNKTFVDNYLDFPVDLSKVLFICSANVVDTITPPLLDRMDLVQLSSYTNSEKKEIFNKHLFPKAITDTGVSSDKFTLDANVVDKLITFYCREPGVRGLQKSVRKIIEKVAYALVKDPQLSHVRVTESDLEKYLGHPLFPPSKIFSNPPAGVVVGLAYTEYGGSLIYIEAMPSSFQGGKSLSFRGGIKTTGSLGKVMQESMQIAYSFARSFAHEKLKTNFLETNEIHVHAPEGAVPKDGPSAGITITSSLISLAINTPINKSIAMTGEMTLRGKVLKIGGVKEKVLAALRENIEELIFPQANEEEVNDLPAETKGNIKFHFVRDFSEVFSLLFPSYKM